MAVYVRPEPSFRRAYVQPVRRRWSGRRLALLLHPIVLLAAIAGSAWSLQVLRRADFLRIDAITVEGNQRLTPGEVAGLVGPLRGENLLVADLDAGRESLLASGWVRDATLRRVLPSVVHVTLAERKPVGLGRFGSYLYLVDATGHILDEFGPRFADLDLPIIDGLSAGVGSDVDTRRAELAARLIAAVGADRDLAHRVSQVDVANPHDAVVLLNGDPVRIHLGEREFAARLRIYLDIMQGLLQAVPEMDYVDLRFDRRVYVGSAATSPVASRWKVTESTTSHARRGAASLRTMAGMGIAAQSGQRRQRGT